jgi:DUF4097 and DUF4098 domain-containing protein YvlB
MLLCAAPACALETFKRELDFDPGGRVVVEIVAGSITVTGSDEAKVLIEGTRDENSGEFSIERDGKVLYIEDHRFGEGAGSDDSTLVIRMPHGSTLEAAVVAGQIDVRDFKGVVEAEAVSGDVNILCSCERIDAASVSGSVTVRSGAPVTRGEFESVSGDVIVEIPLARGGNLDVESVSGRVRLAIAGEINARVGVETGPGGDIDNGFSDQRADRERYSGSESLELRLGDGSGSIDVSVVSGTVTLEKK